MKSDPHIRPPLLLGCLPAADHEPHKAKDGVCVAVMVSPEACMVLAPGLKMSLHAGLCQTPC